MIRSSTFSSKSIYKSRLPLKLSNNAFIPFEIKLLHLQSNFLASSSSYINIPFLSSFNILLQCLRGVTLLKKFYSVWMKKTAIHTFFAVILILTKMIQTSTLSPCIQWTIHHLQLNSWIIHLPIHSLQSFRETSTIWIMFRLQLSDNHNHLPMNFQRLQHHIPQHTLPLPFFR